MFGVETFCRNIRSSTVSPDGLLRELWIFEPELGPRPRKPGEEGVFDVGVTSTVGKTIKVTIASITIGRSRKA